MIMISSGEGELRILATIPIPNACAGRWSHARIGKLMETIQATVAAAEMVDTEMAAESRCVTAMENLPPREYTGQSITKRPHIKAPTITRHTIK